MSQIISIEQEIPFNGKDLMVTLEAEIGECDDGIGSYEFWGMKGYDSHKYIGCLDEDITIKNADEFTQEELNFINDYIGENFSQLEQRLVDGYDPDDYIDPSDDYYYEDNH